jgi:methyl-accepting chemotaxis protein
MSGYIVILMLLVGLSLISVNKVNIINNDMATITDINSVKQRYAINFRGSVHNRAIALRDVTLVSPKEIEQPITEIENLAQEYSKSAGPLDEMLASSSSPDEDEVAILKTIKATEREALPLIKQVVDEQRAGNSTSAHAILMDQARPQFNNWLKEINQFIDLEERKNKEIGTNARNVAETFTFLTAALCGGALLLGSAIALWAIRSLKPLRHLTEIMGRIAHGDFGLAVPNADRTNEIGEIARAVEVFRVSGVERVRLESETASLRTYVDAESERMRTEAEKAQAAQEQAEAMRRLGEGLRSLASGDLRVRMDEGFSAQYAQIRSDFNEAVGSLKETMQAVVTSTSAIHSGTNEISTASDDLSRRTEQQAASLEETAAALDEITATVKKSAESAKHAREVVASADQDAKKSAVVVRQAVEAMDGIAKSSGQITQIIGVIDEIAFQTNLLALNAGVEAARAGDAGRGFAVVASEVRALAQRSADAAKEIKGLISTSTTQVDLGVKLVAETGKSLERIIAQVIEINGVVAEIAAGAQEQATGLQQVNTAINQMDQTTQQNATMVEESTAASHSLSQETTQLSSLIDRFQLGQGGSDAAMRRQLQKVAPHAFQKPPTRSLPAASYATPRVGANNVKPALRRAAANGKVAKGGMMGDDDGGWSEF